VTFVQVSPSKWIGNLPEQAGSTQLYWAVYTVDYAGNAALVVASTDDVLQYGADQAATEAGLGFMMMSVLLFGVVFAASYRIQQGVQAVRKAKKVTTGVKKVAPSGKTIGEPGKKTPLSKDIPTKACPVCKAKIGANLDECPYCHKKF